MNDKFVAAITPELMTDIERLSLKGRDYGITFEVRPSHRNDNNLRDLVIFNPQMKEMVIPSHFFPSSVNMFVAWTYAILDNRPDDELTAIQIHYMHDVRFSVFTKLRQEVIEWYG